jgi:hypothetical protein
MIIDVVSHGGNWTTDAVRRLRPARLSLAILPHDNARAYHNSFHKQVYIVPYILCAYAVGLSP